MFVVFVAVALPVSIFRSSKLSGTNSESRLAFDIGEE